MESDTKVNCFTDVLGINHKKRREQEVVFEMTGNTAKSINFNNRVPRDEGNILDLPNLKTKLINKLEREFELSNKDLLLEDIKEFLLVSDWDDTTIEILLKRDNLLHEFFIAILDDDEINELFENKIKALTVGRSRGYERQRFSAERSEIRI